MKLMFEVKARKFHKYFCFKPTNIKVADIGTTCFTKIAVQNAKRKEKLKQLVFVC